MADRAKPRYQYVSEELRAEILDAQHASAWKFLKIASWKSARNLALISLNSESAIETAMDNLLGLAIEYRDVDVVRDFRKTNWDKWQRDAYWMFNETGFSKLDGVGYVVFTGVLGYLLPAAFPVMDRLTIGGVFGWEVAGRKNLWYRTPVYRTYAEHLAGLQTFGWSNLNVHERDIKVMDAMRPLEKSAGECPLNGVGGLALPDAR